MPYLWYQDGRVVMCLAAFLLLLIPRIPNLTLIPRPTTHIPRLHQNRLCLINVFFVAHFLNSDLYAILRENDILLFHFLGCCVPDGLSYEEDLIGDESQAGDEKEEDEKGED